MINNDKNFFIKDLQKDIISIEKRIKQRHIENTKILAVRSVQIFSKACSSLAPFILISGLVLGGMNLLGLGSPYIREDVPKYASLKTEMNSIGKYRVMESHDRSFEESNFLKIYSDWVINEQGMYERTIDYYTFSNVSVDDFEKIVNGEAHLSDVFHSLQTEILQKKSLDGEENLDSYVEGLLVCSSTEDYIMVKEGVGKNVLLAIVHILLMSLGGSGINFLRHDSLFDKIKKVISCYPMIKKNDNEFLLHQLKIREENLEMFLR